MYVVEETHSHTHVRGHREGPFLSAVLVGRSQIAEAAAEKAADRGMLRAHAALLFFAPSHMARFEVLLLSRSLDRRSWAYPMALNIGSERFE